MKKQHWIMLGTAVSAAAIVSVWAGVPVILKTFRTTAKIYTVTQGTDDLTLKPQFDFERMAGHDLVNLALGTSLDTRRTNEVLALDVDCGSTFINLVVYDKAAGSNIATIASSSSFDVVQQQNNPNSNFPNRERFVADLDIQPGGSDSEALLDGKLMVSGRLHLDPATGCPEDVPVRQDKDKLDKILCDRDFKDADDVETLVRRAGHAHGVGVMDVIIGGTTNKVLIPHILLSVRRQLAP